MKKTVNITDRVNKKNENPTIKIGKTVVEVNSTPMARLLIKQVFDKYEDPSELNGGDIAEICGYIFSKKDMQKLSELNLSDDDFMVVFETAFELLADNIENDSKN